MSRAPRVFLLALVLHLSGSLAAAQAAWNSVTGGPMTMAMPCTGTWDTKTDASGTTTSVYLCKFGDDMYLASWSEYPPSFKSDGPTELKANRDNLLKGVGGVLLTNSDITHQGLPGLDFTGNVKGTHLVTSRVVVRGTQPFMLATLTPLNQDRAANIQRFLASLRIAPPR